MLETLASGSWLARDRVTRVAVICAGFGALMLVALYATSHDTLDAFGRPLGVDFSVFWNAGHIANGRDVVEAWTPDAFNAAARAFHGRHIDASAWLYPPPFMFVAVGLASMPYVVALLAWQILSLLVLAWALRLIVGDWRAVAVALAAPITPMVLGHGQNAFLTAALLGGGLALLSRRPVVAGLLLGALVYKPQLALLLVPYLLLHRRWATIAGAAAAVVALCGLSLLFWGPDAWAAFARSLSIGRSYMEQGVAGYWKSGSLYAAARLNHASMSLAYMVQGAGVLFALWLVWRLRNASEGLRHAGLCAGAALATPYLLDYDLAVVGLGGAFVYAEMRRSPLTWEATSLSLIWAIPLFLRPVALLTHIPLGPISAVLLGFLALRRALEHRHPAVDVQGLPGDVSGLAAGEVDHRRADILP